MSSSPVVSEPASALKRCPVIPSPLSAMSAAANSKKQPKERSLLRRTGKLLWDWGPFARNAHRPEDRVYFDIWNTARDEESVRGILSATYPSFPAAELPTTEAEIRQFLRQNITSRRSSDGSYKKVPDIETEANKGTLPLAEECWEQVPHGVRHLLAAMNADSLEVKLRLLSAEDFHCKRGVARMRRSSKGITKTFNMWRKGFKAGVTVQERVCIQIFFWFLLFCNVFPNVAAGFLGERGYNVRQTGVRAVTFIQWCYLMTFDYPVFWLLFNWSLERLIGALLGNTAYALAAAVPAVHTAYYTTWFRNMLLGLSTSWQIVIQFYFAARDYVERLVTRRQMKALRKRNTGVDWATVDMKLKQELMPLNVFQAQRGSGQAPTLNAEDVPLRVRIERHLQFSNTFKLGRPADMLVGLQKDDIENLLNIFEDYQSSAPGFQKSDADVGHVEPRLPKFLLVIFDIAIFAYISYSFWFQPFNFNTVVAYGAVVIIKQTILALKRYQTVKAARRLFTNMTAFNIWGIFLVSVPTTVNRNVFADDATFAGLLVGMTIATVFFTEPLAPLFSVAGEKATNGCVAAYRACRQIGKPGSRRRQPSSVENEVVIAHEKV